MFITPIDIEMQCSSSVRRYSRKVDYQDLSDAVAIQYIQPCSLSSTISIHSHPRHYSPGHVLYMHARFPLIVLILPEEVDHTNMSDVSNPITFVCYIHCYIVLLVLFLVRLFCSYFSFWEGKRWLIFLL